MRSLLITMVFDARLYRIALPKIARYGQMGEELMVRNSAKLENVGPNWELDPAETD